MPHLPWRRAELVNSEIRLTAGSYDATVTFDFPDRPADERHPTPEDAVKAGDSMLPQYANIVAVGLLTRCCSPAM